MRLKAQSVSKLPTMQGESAAGQLQRPMKRRGKDIATPLAASFASPVVMGASRPCIAPCTGTAVMSGYCAENTRKKVPCPLKSPLPGTPISKHPCQGSYILAVSPAAV